MVWTANVHDAVAIPLEQSSDYTQLVSIEEVSLDNYRIPAVRIQPILDGHNPVQ